MVEKKRKTRYKAWLERKDQGKICLFGTAFKGELRLVKESRLANLFMDRLPHRAYAGRCCGVKDCKAAPRSVH